jgi:hypothetical protein
MQEKTVLHLIKWDLFRTYSSSYRRQVRLQQVIQLNQMAQILSFTRQELIFTLPNYLLHQTQIQQ